MKVSDDLVKKCINGVAWVSTGHTKIDLTLALRKLSGEYHKQKETLDRFAKELELRNKRTLTREQKEIIVKVLKHYIGDFGKSCRVEDLLALMKTK